MKKSLNIILIVVGLFMTIYGATAYADKDTVVEIGNVNISKDLEITKDEKHRLNWLSVSGGAICLLGLGMTVAGRKRG